MKLETGHILITPSALDKGRITADQIGMLSEDGENLTPQLKTSIETDMHISVYKARQDVRAVVHAHPVTATSFTAMKSTLLTTLTAGSVCSARHTSSGSLRADGNQKARLYSRGSSKGIQYRTHGKSWNTNNWSNNP